MPHEQQCRAVRAVVTATLGTVILMLLMETADCMPATASGANKYLNLYKRAEKFNFEEIVQSKRLFGNYVNCFVEKGPCTESAKDGRVLLTDVMDKWCVDICSAKLKGNLQVALRAFRDRHPDEWQIFLNKTDPMEAKRTKLAKFMEGKE